VRGRAAVGGGANSGLATVAWCGAQRGGCRRAQPPVPPLAPLPRLLALPALPSTPAATGPRHAPATTPAAAVAVAVRGAEQAEPATAAGGRGGPIRQARSAGMGFLPTPSSTLRLALQPGRGRGGQGKARLSPLCGCLAAALPGASPALVLADLVGAGLALPRGEPGSRPLLCRLLLLLLPLLLPLLLLLLPLLRVPLLPPGDDSTLGCDASRRASPFPSTTEGGRRGRGARVPPNLPASCPTLWG